VNVDIVHIRDILTRTSGFLATVSSHSLQPYRGCSFGRALCGAYCYVQHSRHLLRGREWGRFLEVRVNAASSYLENVERERNWARRARGLFGVFLSSSTEPFLPQEDRYGITRQVLQAMLSSPPDRLILQTHSHRVAGAIEVVRDLSQLCDLRVHVSIESDREAVPGLPRHANSVAARFAAARALKEAGITTVVTVSPLLPIADPDGFFARIAECAHAVVLDHFIGGDGTPDGRRTRATALPAAMAALDPATLGLDYRERMVAVARKHLPGRVGVNIDGFAGRYLPE
jgi:DNA repair photolyase